MVRILKRNMQWRRCYINLEERDYGCSSCACNSTVSLCYGPLRPSYGPLRPCYGPLRPCYGPLRPCYGLRQVCATENIKSEFWLTRARRFASVALTPRALVNSGSTSVRNGKYCTTENSELEGWLTRARRSASAASTRAPLRRQINVVW